MIDDCYEGSVCIIVGGGDGLAVIVRGREEVAYANRAAAEHMASQAEQLLSVVSRFRVDEHFSLEEPKRRALEASPRPRLPATTVAPVAEEDWKEF